MKRKILVLELWGLGDLTFSTVLIEGALKAGDEVHLVGKSHAQPLLQPTFPSVRFFSFDAGWTKFQNKYHFLHWHWSAFFSLLKQLRKERYDAVVSVRDDPRDHLLMALIGVRERYGFAYFGSGMFLTHSIRRTHGPFQHKVEDWRDLAKAMGIPGMESAQPRLRHAAYRSNRIDVLFQELALPVLVLHAGARIAIRRWPVAYLEELILQLRKEFHFHLILIPDPDGYGSSLAALADTVLNDLTLAELIDMIGRASLLLCNDSGPGHLAAGCGRPTLAIFGPTQVDWFRPWGDIHHPILRDICRHRPCFDYCHYPEPYCMTRLRPGMVWPEVRAQIHQLVRQGVLPAGMVKPDAPPFSPLDPGKPFVVVITATYRRADHLERMLCSLEPAATPLAVLVVDNADDPQTAAVVRAAQTWMEITRLVPGENLGCGGGHAYGEQIALERYGDRVTHFWLMDDDICLAPGALERLLAALREEGASLACPMITWTNGEIGWEPGLLEAPPFDALRKKIIRTPQEYLKQFGPRPVPFSWAPGVSLLVTREAFDALGPHRTDFLIRGEDFEFSLRISASRKAIYVPDAQLTHYCSCGPQTPEAVAAERKKQVAMLHNVAYIGCRLPHGRRIFRCLPGNLWRHLKNWGLSGLPEGLLAYWKGGVLGYPAGANKHFPAISFPAESALPHLESSAPLCPSLPDSFSREQKEGGAEASVLTSTQGQSEEPNLETQRTEKLKLKILQIFNRYLQYGGEEGSVYRIGDALMEDKEVEYYIQSTAGLIGEGWTDKILALGKVFHNSKAVLDLRRMQEISQFDIWQIHNVFPALSPAVYKEAFRLGVPVVHYLHNYRMGCINGFFLDHGNPCQRCMGGNFLPAVQAKCWHESRFLCGWMAGVMKRVQMLDVFHKVSRWVAISEAQKAVHVEMGIPEDRIDVIPHFYESKRSALPLPENGYALFLGRLSAEKGCMELLKAWRGIPAGRKLVITGDGPEMPLLQKYARDAGLTNVKFVGFIPKEQQETLWRGAAFLVVPSIWLEPFGMVVLEAWSWGRTVVANCIGALPEIITHGKNGLLVPPFNPEALAAEMERLFKDTDLLNALSIQARIELETRFSKAEWQRKINQNHSKTLSSRR